MSNTVKAIEEVRKVNATFPYTDPIKAWKEKEKKQAIGFLCTYIPEEIIHAAGILPVRITGDSEEIALDEANALLHIYVCSFARTCLQLARQGKYDFLDGFVGASTCDPIRRLSDVWEHFIPTPFFHVLRVPKKFTQDALDLFQVQVRKFKEDLEKFIGQEISEASLRDSIRVYNKNRELLRKFLDLRRADHPPISGGEMLEVMNARFRMPVEQHSELLENLLQEISEGNRALEGKHRIMFIGSMMNNADFLKTLEDLGGQVVVDELCTGTRCVWDLVDNTLPPVEALCRRYLNHFPCPRMVPAEERFKRVLNLIRDYRVEGVIVQMLRYCAPYTRHQAILSDRFKQENIPVLPLDIEYGMGGIGPVRTRVQAFYEMLEERKQMG